MHVYGREFSSCCSRHAAEQAAYPAYGLTRTKPNYPVKRDARVEHIALDIRLDHANDAADAEALLRFSVIEPRLSVLKLDSRELRIRSVRDEKNNALEFTVTLSAPVGRPVTVQLDTADGSATAADNWPAWKSARASTAHFRFRCSSLSRKPSVC